MLSLSSSLKIYLYRGITDMRKSFNGLSGLVEQNFPGELLTGALFIFSNRKRNMIKILYWDSDGLALWYKRLEKGRFKLPGSGDKYELQRRELMAILEGVTPLRYDRRFSLK
jgi:transposase